MSKISNSSCSADIAEWDPPSQSITDISPFLNSDKTIESKQISK